MNTQPISVLLVEDNPGDVHLIQEMLTDGKATSFEVTCADRLSTCAERLSERIFDAILLDLSLPDSQGLATLVWVHDQASNVPILVLMGLEDEGTGVQAMRKGAQDCLVKEQMDEHLLVRTIRYAVERRQFEETVQESERRLAGIDTLRQVLVILSHHISNATAAIAGHKELYPFSEMSADKVLSQTNRVSTALDMLSKMVTEMYIQTVDYTELQDAMVGIERELRHTLREREPVRESPEEMNPVWYERM